MNQITKITGKAFYLPGANMDTDRIIPARFLKCVSFIGIEEHAFADERVKARDAGTVHPFDDPQNAGASILVVDTNFGCGSSREHAVQCIMRWGIKAIVSCAKSGSPGFADIFRGNAAANGIPCVELNETDHLIMVERLKHAGTLECEINLEDLMLYTDYGTPPEGDHQRITMQENHRWMLTSGAWDTTAVLLEAGDAIERTANQLPYVNPAVLLA